MIYSSLCGSIKFLSGTLLAVQTVSVFAFVNQSLQGSSAHVVDCSRHADQYYYAEIGIFQAVHTKYCNMDVGHSCSAALQLR